MRTFLVLVAHSFGAWWRVICRKSVGAGGVVGEPVFLAAVPAFGVCERFLARQMQAAVSAAHHEFGARWWGGGWLVAQTGEAPPQPPDQRGEGDEKQQTGHDECL